MRTIAAISTPRGKGGIAVIRISGDTAFAVTNRVFRTKSGVDAADLIPRHAYYGDIMTPEGELLDKGICTFFPGPGSFTGEDVAEISCHGGTYVTHAVLMAVLAAGAEMAGPGEFTKRAFINGNLSLTEAEAVGLLIDADTEERMKLAGSGVRGWVSKELTRLSTMLFDVMTALYAAVDYPEEDVGDEGERQIAGVVTEVLGQLRRLLATYKTGRAIAQGVKTVICGRPNAGKSSLFNLMAGTESAIVTDIAGTTRDVLREVISFGGITLRISDTAGLRETGDTVEKIGVRRAEEEIREAELILAVMDPSVGLGEEERAMAASYPDCPRIAVLNKGDTGAVFSEKDLAWIRENHDAVVMLSCRVKQAEGLEKLRETIAQLWGTDRLEIGRDAVIWDVRQQAALHRAVEFLADAADGLAQGAPLDAVCTVCEGALAALDETDGRGVTSAIADEIFMRFCVGK